MAEQVEDRDHALRVRAVQARLLEQMGRDPSFARALTTHTPSMLDLANATGGAVCLGGDIVTVGETPPRAWITELVEWLRQRDEPLFATSALPTHYPPAGRYKGLASGLIAAHISATRADYVLWFRPESKQTVKWAGDPRKVVEVDAGGAARLSPRGSFELWEETVKGTAAPWVPAETEAAAELRSTVIDVLLRRADEIAALNEELEHANEQLLENAAELEVQAEELAATTTELLQQRDEREALLGRERRARAEAERAQADAQAANKTKADFLAMMSHELRTPLNAIGGYAQLLELGVRGATTAEQRADLARIQTNQRHLLGIINNILNFAKVEAGQVQITLDAVALGPLLDDAEGLVAPQIAAKALAYELVSCADAPHAAPAMVWADEDKLRQILLNLLSNAVKFTPEGGRISVACDVQAAHVTLRVRDTGRGIPPERIGTIFDPFVQVDRHLTDAGSQGVGLGLAISRDLARRMGGDLTAESAPGVGSTFTLVLPRATGPDGGGRGARVTAGATGVEGRGG
jgi:light-regulated signal transduction histidine kinase (bacteriophytochrome)